MGSFNRSFAGKKRETHRRALRAYCQKVGWRGSLVLPCYKCDLIKGGMDCRGNPIGTRELEIAKAMASILELQAVSPLTNRGGKVTNQDQQGSIDKNHNHLPVVRDERNNET